jgi:acetylornithine aminotransferase
MGELLQSTLRRLDGVKEVRGKGLLQAVEFEQPVAAGFVDRCLAEGLIVNATDASTIRLAPPLIISPDEIEYAGQAMRRAQTPR